MDTAGGIKRLTRAAACILCLGLLYILWISATGLFIPCPFREITGLLCPGCGVSHLCMALIHFDISAAWRANAGLLCSLPLLVFTLVMEIRRYLTGAPASRAAIASAWCLLAWLLLWGVLRNLPINL